MRTLLAALALTAALAAQTPPKTEPVEEAPAAITVDVNLVSLLASVRDKRGGLVANLEKDDFSVFEDGKAQSIKYFTRETDLPLTIGLLVDVSKSQEVLIDIERHAASEFFAQVLRKKDEAFLISFGAESELLQDLTNSPKLLNAGLNELRLNAPAVGIQPGPVPTISQPRGTVLYDAVYLAATEKLRAEVGRKVIVLISDGVDQGSKLKIDEAIMAVQKGDVVIYSIEYSDPRYQPGFGLAGSGGALRRLSEETGGHAYRVDRSHSLEQIFKELQDEMRSQYMIGYTSTNEARDGGYRKLEVKLARKDLKAQVRKGYYAPTGDRRPSSRSAR
jgi:VWFA-related protein